jgi:SH3-like domain-containing protein
MALGMASAFAQTEKEAFRSTNYPLPRFVSLGSDEVFSRTGPGKLYPVRYAYKRKSLPVEIILEYEGWRKIRDFDGDEGWVHTSMVSGNRTALVKGTENVTLHRSPNADSRKSAYIEPQNIVNIEECNGQWCEVNAAGYTGWIEQKYLWGVYESEKFD